MNSKSSSSSNTAYFNGFCSEYERRLRATANDNNSDIDVKGPPTVDADPDTRVILLSMLDEIRNMYDSALEGGDGDGYDATAFHVNSSSIW